MAIGKEIFLEIISNGCRSELHSTFGNLTHLCISLGEFLTTPSKLRGKGFAIC
jgi:hypothetical protein